MLKKHISGCLKELRSCANLYYFNSESVKYIQGYRLSHDLLSKIYCVSVSSAQIAVQPSEISHKLDTYLCIFFVLQGNNTSQNRVHLCKPFLRTWTRGFSCESIDIRRVSILFWKCRFCSVSPDIACPCFSSSYKHACSGINVVSDIGFTSMNSNILTLLNNNS